jgi:hypothetical protein
MKHSINLAIILVKMKTKCDSPTNDALQRYLPMMEID